MGLFTPSRVTPNRGCASSHERNHDFKSQVVSCSRSLLRVERLLGLNVDLVGDRPDEPDPLPRHGHHPLVGMLASGDERSVAFTQAHLSLPAEVLQPLGLLLESQLQMAAHSTIARADAALGKAGIEEVTHLVIQPAHGVGVGDEGVISSDPTAQELAIGYPNEPGMLRGVAQRCGRALMQLQKRGIQGLEAPWEQGGTIWRSVKDPPSLPRAKRKPARFSFAS
jgi:hypothetical protein